MDCVGCFRPPERVDTGMFPVCSKKQHRTRNLHNFAQLSVPKLPLGLFIHITFCKQMSNALHTHTPRREWWRSEHFFGGREKWSLGLQRGGQRRPPPNLPTPKTNSDIYVCLLTWLSFKKKLVRDWNNKQINKKKKLTVAPPLAWG